LKKLYCYQNPTFPVVLINVINSEITMQKQRKSPEFCGATFREWNACERFCNQVLLSVAWRTYWLGLFTV